VVGLLVSLMLLTASAKNDNCQFERIVNMLAPWADRIELEYDRTYDFEMMVREDLHHIDSWGDANIGDIWFEVIDEMREYADECTLVND